MGKKLHKKTEMFEYVTEHGNICLPYVENLEMSLIEDNAGATLGEFIGKVYEHYMGDVAREIRRKLTLAEFNEMTGQWLKSSAMDLGELFS